jgi:hypothetical protein
MLIVSENGEYMKLKRGQKLCKNCNKINGARAYICKHCNTEFAIGIQAKNKFKRKKVKKFEYVDWKLLQKGDTIKVIGRSGNYHINSEGEKSYMSDPGIYTVHNTDENGLIVYSKNHGFGYIYMGEEKPHSYLPNVYRSPHKIIKINMPVRI